MLKLYFYIKPKGPDKFKDNSSENIYRTETKKFIRKFLQDWKKIVPYFPTFVWASIF